MFFNSWYDILRVIVMGITSYLALISLLRVSGKRTLSQMNMFDFVVTIALGSVFASIILSKEVAMAEGFVGMFLLILMQWLVASLSVRSVRFRKIVKGDPTLLYYEGAYLHQAMKAERITGEEIRFAARSQGVHDMADLRAVVLETNGTFSVIPRFSSGTDEVLQDLELPNAPTPNIK